MTELELLERRPPHGPTGKKPLLFVHGYWQAAWCWDEYVMPALAALGYECFALSLTGHGGSEGRIRGRSISDHVSDVYETLVRFDDPPVIIGHSMGAYTLQHYLELGHPASGAVLVAPVPPRGAWKATWRTASRYPGAFLKANLLWDIGVIVERPERARQILFSPALPATESQRFDDRWERASYRTYIDLLFKRPDLSEVKMPALVIGGTEDALFSVEEFEQTASALGAELIVLEGAGHQVMLEPAWRELVAAIDRFAQGL